MNSIKKTSQIAGFWYLLVAVFGSFYTMFVDSKLIVSGDAATTINNLLTSEWLFRFCILSNILTTVCFLILANSLWKLFKSVEIDLVRMMIIFIIASVPAASLQFIKFAPLLLASKSAYLSAFEPAQLQALGMLSIELGKIAGINTYVFYGLWLFPLGMLVFKSRPDFVTKVVGVSLMVGCFGYLSKFVEVFFGLNTEAITSLWMGITIFSEVLCILWLFFLGPKEQKQNMAIVS